MRLKLKHFVHFFIICILLAFIAALCLPVDRITTLFHSIPANAFPAEEYITMYSAESEAINVPLSKINEPYHSNLSNAPITTVYTCDGRSETIYESEIQHYKSNGWYTEPVATMTRNDESKTVGLSEFEKYRGDGWFISEYNLNMTELGTKLKDFIASRTGNFGIYVKNLNTNDVLLLNDGQYASASIIKLFTMAALYNEINNGNLTMTDRIASRLRSMITVSDNQCANNLVTVIGQGDCRKGFDTINKFAHSSGCVNTQHLSQFSINNKYTAFGKNLVSPYDCGILLEKIYNGTLVSKEFSQEMLNLLKEQHLTNKIPNPLPEGTVTANKTGETSNIQSDVAIVFSPKCDYIICVVTNDAPSGIEDIRHISKLTYDHFNL